MFRSIFNIKPMNNTRKFDQIFRRNYFSKTLNYYSSNMKKLILKLISKKRNGGYDLNILLTHRTLDLIDFTKYSKNVPILVKSTQDNEVWIYGKNYQGFYTLTKLNKEKYKNIPFITVNQKENVEKLDASLLSKEIYDDITSKKAHIHDGFLKMIDDSYQKFKNDKPNVEGFFKYIAYAFGAYIITYALKEYFEINKKIGDINLSLKKQIMENFVKLKEIEPYLKEVKPYLYLTTPLLDEDIISHNGNQRELTQAIHKFQHYKNELSKLKEQLNNNFLVNYKKIQIKMLVYNKSHLFNQIKKLEESVDNQIEQLKCIRKFDKAKYLHKSRQYAHALVKIDKVISQIKIEKEANDLLFKLIGLTTAAQNIKAKLHACLMITAKDEKSKKIHYKECEASYKEAINFSIFGEYSLRLMLSEKGNFEDLVKTRKEIIIVNINNEFKIFYKSRIDKKVHSFICDEYLKDFILPLSLSFNGEILVKNEAYENVYKRVYSEVMSRGGDAPTGTENTIEHSFLLSGLSYLYDGTGKHKEALEIHRKALSINPDSTVILSGIGLNLHKIELNESTPDPKKLEEAYACFSKAIALNPENGLANIYNDRGKLRIYMKDEEGALADFEKAISINPHLKEPRIKAAELLFKKNLYDRAEKYYGVALIIEPTRIQKTRNDMDEFEKRNNLKNKMSQKPVLYLYKQDCYAVINETSKSPVCNAVKANEF